jgi:hypothetical protein
MVSEGDGLTLALGLSRGVGDALDFEAVGVEEGDGSASVCRGGTRCWQGWHDFSIASAAPCSYSALHARSP